MNIKLGSEELVIEQRKMDSKISTHEARKLFVKVYSYLDKRDARRLKDQGMGIHPTGIGEDTRASINNIFVPPREEVYLIEGKGVVNVYARFKDRFDRKAKVGVTLHATTPELREDLEGILETTIDLEEKQFPDSKQPYEDHKPASFETSYGATE